MNHITLTLTALALPSLASAHAGDHSHVDGLWHLLTEPDHLAMIVAAVVVAVLAWRMGRRHSRSRRDE